MQLILLSSGAVTIRPATLALATSALLPGKLAPSVRPLGSTAVSVRMHVAMPGAAPGTGVQVPLLPRISLTIGELTVTGEDAGTDRDDHVGRGQRHRDRGGLAHADRRW